jgi:lysophospholipase L1-like esterase
MPPAALHRWNPTTPRARNIACLGDSITYDGISRRAGMASNWVHQLASAFDGVVGTRPGDGYRGLWRDDEWQQAGTWTRTAKEDAFDLAPYRKAFYSSGSTADELTWRKPAGMQVGAFDLYWFGMPGGGAWQYRVDDGDWTTAVPEGHSSDNRLHRVFVGEAVSRQVVIRGHDGSRPCIAPIAGISVYTSPNWRCGTIVHNLALGQQLISEFCRLPSAGDPLALLDDLRPELVTIMFSNDVRFRAPDRFARLLRHLLERVAPYADALVMAPFEQRPPRCVHDAVTTDGSSALASATARFTLTDHGAEIRGTNIPAGTRIASVVSPEAATMSHAASGSSRSGELCVGGMRDAAIQAAYRDVTRAVAAEFGSPVLDLYEQWAEELGPGWDAAYEAGLMFDGLHPTQLGNDDIARRVRAVLGV